MDEAQHLADRVAILAAGRSWRAGEPDELGAAQRPDQAVVRSARPPGVTLERRAAALGPRRGRRRPGVVPDRGRAAGALPPAELGRARGTLTLDGLEVSRPSLEDVFLQLTGGAGDQPRRWRRERRRPDRAPDRLRRSRACGATRARRLHGDLPDRAAAPVRVDLLARAAEATTNFRRRPDRDRRLLHGRDHRLRDHGGRASARWRSASRRSARAACSSASAARRCRRGRSSRRAVCRLDRAGHGDVGRVARDRRLAFSVELSRPRASRSSPSSSCSGTAAMCCARHRAHASPRRPDSASTIAPFGTVILAFISGVFIPTDQLPNSLVQIGKVFPLAHLAHGSRRRSTAGRSTYRARTSPCWRCGAASGW